MGLSIYFLNYLLQSLIILSVYNIILAIHINFCRKFSVCSILQYVVYNTYITVWCTYVQMYA